MSNFSLPCVFNEKAAREYLEEIRWPNGPYCPHCGEFEKIKKLEGKSHRPGLHQCNSCRGHFTVTVGTLYERSKIPLHKWLMATFLMCSSKKGISAHQLHRMLGITYKSAWFMCHRIREAMMEDDNRPMGGPGKAIQADETYFGKVDNPKTKTVSGRPFTKSGKHGPSNKLSIVSLVEPGGGVRSFNPHTANSETIRKILKTHVSPESELHTDESRLYMRVGREFKDHKKVVHARGRYVGPSGESTNAVENYFSVFKRGMKGIYQHCGERHLHRYLAEFDFRYNARKISDLERARLALRGIEGKRLTYKRVSL